MTDETTQAFGPLEGRAAGTAVCDTPPDRISVRDHEVAVEIGAFQAERGVTQRLRFDVVVEVGAHDGADTDDVDDILSYDTITEAIKQVSLPYMIRLRDLLKGMTLMPFLSSGRSLSRRSKRSCPRLFQAITGRRLAAVATIFLHLILQRVHDFMKFLKVRH